MSRYILTERTKKILEARGYDEHFVCVKCGMLCFESKKCMKCSGSVIIKKIGLICKICDCPLLVGDEIESKQQRRGKSKLYHANCYDGSFMELPDVTDEEVEQFFSRPKAILTDERIIVWIVRSL